MTQRRSPNLLREIVGEVLAQQGRTRYQELWGRVLSWPNTLYVL